MADKAKILLVDDSQDILEMYKEFLARVPGEPEVQTANSGARALALLDAEPFSMLITDLNMPNMDGFQVLTIVRRKFPSLRTVVMSAISDEHFRSRSYAMGIDLFLEKPKSSHDIDMFVECVGALLERAQMGGFRGMQSKSLVDLIQLECLSQNSCVLRITNGALEGKIWVLNGDLVDSTVGDLTSETAFKKILTWKTGNFEALPAEPNRERTIFNSYQGLLLDSAQSIDEAEMGDAAPAPAEGQAAPVSPLVALGRTKGVQFVLQVNDSDAKKFDQWGVDNAEQLAGWTHKTIGDLRVLGEKLMLGSLNQVEAIGPQINIAILYKPGKELLIGMDRNLSADEIRESAKNIYHKWGS
jgi:CheY-like chemotaxis protein